MIKVRIDGQVSRVPAIKGANGKSAYQYAVEGGFEGTEQEFINLLIQCTDTINYHLTDNTAHTDIRELISSLQKDLENKIDNVNITILQADWNQTDETAQDYIKNKPFGVSEDGEITKLDSSYLPDRYSDLVLTDEVTGLDYIVKMNDGKLVYTSLCEAITITQLPTNVQIQDAEFDPTGIVVIASCEDGTTRDITSSCTYDVDMSVVGTTTVTVNYTERGVTHSATIDIEVVPASLVDFEFITNEDGTYTITAWKQTLNGEPSTEMVFPDDPMVQL